MRAGNSGSIGHSPTGNLTTPFVAQTEAGFLRHDHLLGDVRRHPEWWPRVIDVQCDELAEGCTFRQVTKRPVGRIESDIVIERLDVAFAALELKMELVEEGFVIAERRNEPLEIAGLGRHLHPDQRPVPRLVLAELRAI